MSNYGPSQYSRYAKLGTICMTSSDTLVSNQKYFPLDSKAQTAGRKIYPMFYSGFPTRSIKVDSQETKEKCCGR